MTQGKPLEKSREEFKHAWKMARKRDTLHLLVIVLREEALARGDTQTAALIDDTLGRLGEGDRIKIELVGRIRQVE